MRRTNHASVRDHIVKYHGYTAEGAEALVRRRTAIVQDGIIGIRR